MPRTLCLVAALLLAPLAHARPAPPAPDPAAYPATVAFHGKPAEPVLNSRQARRFRTVIREGAKDGPNFAGHYTVVSWGCGLGSFSFAVVDAISGRVYLPPLACLTLAGGYHAPLPGFAEADNPGYRLDSRLIVVSGIEDRPELGPEDRQTIVYVFERGRFRKLYSAPALLPGTGRRIETLPP